MSVSGVNNASLYRLLYSQNSSSGGSCSSSSDASSTDGSSSNSFELDLLQLTSGSDSTSSSTGTDAASSAGDDSNASDDSGDPLQTLIADLQTFLKDFGPQGSGGPGGPSPAGGPPPGGPPPGGALIDDSSSSSISGDDSDTDDSGTSFQDELQKLLQDVQSVLGKYDSSAQSYLSTGATSSINSSTAVGSLLDAST